MSIWIKICGLREANTLNAVVETGVQAIGFVFADSVRQITPKEASLLVRDIPSDVARVGVFLRPSQNEVNAVLDVVELDYIQADWQALSAVELPTGTTGLPVVREAIVQEQDQENNLPKQFLFEGAHSGEGEKVDWQLAHQLAAQYQLILAGGLNPSNITEAIKLVKPFGVDVSSGVESARGIKDKKLIAEFVRLVRQATLELDSAS